MFSNEEKYRTNILASTIYGQGKTIHQAEIDAVAELADFLNFNAFYLEQLETDQPYSLNATDAENFSNWNFGFLKFLFFFSSRIWKIFNRNIQIWGFRNFLIPGSGPRIFFEFF